MTDRGLGPADGPARAWLVVDDALVAEAARAAGIGPDDGAEAVVHRIRAWLPAGSAAKRAAVDAGRRPPGDDPGEVLATRLSGDRRSWSCWGACAAVGAVLTARGHDVRVAAEHRRSPGSPVVDVHSVLVVDGAVVDPFLGPSALLAPGVGATRVDGWAELVPGVRWDHVGVRAGSRPFRYRLLADHLDRRDVAALLEVSVTHTGVGRRRTASWVGDRADVAVLPPALRTGAPPAPGPCLWSLRDGEVDGADAELRVTVGDDPFATARVAVARGPWDELLAAVHLDPA